LGIALPLLLAGIALAALALSVAGPLWAQRQQRERERELLRIGLLYAQALAAYQAASPGGQKVLPSQLENLVLDSRFVGTQRYLRRLYPDPIDTRAPWGLLRDAQGRIAGVFSQSEKAPMARGPVVLADRTLAPATTYRDWKFVVEGKT
jgi:type II secretory pathway pseudopilin PulG